MSFDGAPHRLPGPARPREARVPRPMSRTSLASSWASVRQTRRPLRPRLPTSVAAMRALHGRGAALRGRREPLMRRGASRPERRCISSREGRGPPRETRAPHASRGIPSRKEGISPREGHAPPRQTRIPSRKEMHLSTRGPSPSSVDGHPVPKADASLHERATPLRGRREPLMRPGYASRLRPDADPPHYLDFGQLLRRLP
jgi:hypothetical protein